MKKTSTMHWSAENIHEQMLRVWRAAENDESVAIANQSFHLRCRRRGGAAGEMS
jgi:hypothetical protein